MTSCRACGEPLTANDRFCPKCGIASGSPATPTAAVPTYSPWAQVQERLKTATTGEFHVLRELGRGGMAAVYLAQEVTLNRLVAIKVMAPGMMMGEGMVDRFRQEAVTVANLSHPNIITIHTVRQLDDLHFFVMKFVDGQPLDVVLQAAGILPIPIIRSILFQVGSGLAYAHRRGVIHRDIKPANILLDRDGNAIVTDFGIAKVAEVPGQTKTGTMVGTPAYMSPEQCVAETVTWASDQYSLGVVAYELLTGAPPFAGSSYAIMQGHLEKTAAPLADVRPDCPPSLADAVLRMLAKTPAERFPTMPAALQALGAVPLTDDDPLRLELEALVGGSRVAASPAEALRAARIATPPTTPSPRAALITLGGAPDEVEAGDTFTLTAQVLDATRAELRGSRVSWTSSEPAVATVGTDGAVATRNAGSVTITAQAGDASESVRIEVRPARPAELEVVADVTELVVGARAQLSVIAQDRRGIPLRPVVAWATSDPAIATISAAGLAVATAPGSARITATVGELESSVELAVRLVAVAKVRLGRVPRQLLVGQRAELTADAVDASGQRLADRMVHWLSSDPAVAEVDESGALTARGAGSATIVATCEDRESSAVVAVAEVPVATVVIGEPAGPLEIGQSVRLNVGVRDAAGAPLERHVRWTSGSERIARVTPDGVVTAVAPGKTKLTATAEGVSGTARIVVAAAPVVAGVTPAPARWRPRRAVVWGVLAVIGIAGAVLLLTRGADTPDEHAVITPPAPPSTGAPAPTTPSASPAGNSSAPGPAASRLVIRPVTLVLTAGQRAPLRAFMLDARGNALSGDAPVWSSSDARTAAVDASGRVTASRPGVATITALAGPHSATIVVTVAGKPEPGVASAAAVASVAVTGSASVAEGDTVSLRAAARDSGRRAMTGRRAIWSSDAPAVASVDPANGTVVGRRPGRATITATIDGVSGDLLVAVVPKPAVERPAPAAVTPPAAGSTAGAESAARAAANDCFAALKAVDAGRLAALYQPATDRDRKNSEKLLTLMRRKEWAFATTTAGVAPAAQTSGDHAFADFMAQVTWKSSFGNRRDVVLNFRAEVQRAAGGGWEPAGCRLQGTPDL